jgi:hypothetical protein
MKESLKHVLFLSYLIIAVYTGTFHTSSTKLRTRVGEVTEFEGCGSLSSPLRICANRTPKLAFSNMSFTMSFGSLYVGVSSSSSASRLRYKACRPDVAAEPTTLLIKFCHY